MARFVMDMVEAPGLSESPDGVVEKEDCTVGIFLSNQLGNFSCQEFWPCSCLIISLRLSLEFS